VASDDLVKGYECQKGRFAVLTKEDFQSAALDKTRTVAACARPRLSAVGRLKR
jgi:non-homologous end joining protein Ku